MEVRRLALESDDVIIIGTGAGGGTLAHRVAPSGKRLLILERGGFLPREKENWDSTAVFQEMRYHTSEKWYDADVKSCAARRLQLRGVAPLLLIGIFPCMSTARNRTQVRHRIPVDCDHRSPSRRLIFG